MRIVTGTIHHETSTFTTVPTTWESYRNRRFGFLRGQQVLDKFTDTNTALGGFVDGCADHDFELIPTIFASAHPSAPTPREIFDEILSEMLGAMRSAGIIDGVLMDLHGAMVVEGIDDGEGHVLAAVRDLVGPDVPIVAQFDIHSNVSRQMVEMADVMIGHETFPEIDQQERGKECVDVMHRILREGLRPTLALCQLPLAWGMNQVTAHPPMRSAIELLHEIEARPRVICGSIATCFPLADTPDMGASVYIATDDDEALAQSYADELGQWLWERRADWQLVMPSTRDALTLADTAGSYPVIFADRNDNTGGGAPGDSTGMLQTFINADLQDACILYMVDPEAVTLCQQAGVGAELTLTVGGKSTPIQGHPVEMTATVVALGDGHFLYDGPRNRGLAGNMGPSAHLVQKGVHVLVVSHREQPYDTAFARSMELDPQNMRYIGVKSAAHFRAGFEAWSGAIHVVSEPNVHSAEAVAGRFKNLRRKVYPFEDVW